MLPLQSSGSSICKECITLVEKVQHYKEDSCPSVSITKLPTGTCYIPGLHSDAITRSVNDENLAPLSIVPSLSTTIIDTYYGSTSTDHPAWSPGHSLLNHHGTFRLKPSKTTEEVKSFFCWI